jgi:S1-C subfamily serine protease
MSKKAVYQLSARQILFLALASAFIAVGLMACVSNFGSGSIWQAREMANIASAEDTAAPQVISEPSTVSDEQNSIEVYRTLSPGVAFITSSELRQNYFGALSETPSGSGSGSVIDNQGRILTNYHVIEGAQKLMVSLGGAQKYPAKVIGGDPDTDLAVIQIEPPASGLTVIQLGDSDRLSVGQKVLAIGNPFGLDRTLTTGVISGLERPIRGANNRPIEGAIQTDASINPGNSGGPLLDKYGRMIGINSQILSRSGGSVGVGFAIPVSIAKRVVPQLIQFGEVRRPKLGAALASMSELERSGFEPPADKGLLILETTPSASAAQAGLRGQYQMQQGRIGDILTAVDGTQINDRDDLFRLLDKKQIGDTVQVTINRDGRTLTVPVKLVPLPQQIQSRPTQRRF